MQHGFVHAWGRAAYTMLGFFWMALWAFVLGYVVSSMILGLRHARADATRNGRGRGAELMAFIFSDLIVFPVLRINAAYYG